MLARAAVADARRGGAVRRKLTEGDGASVADLCYSLQETVFAMLVCGRTRAHAALVFPAHPRPRASGRRCRWR